MITCRYSPHSVRRCEHHSQSSEGHEEMSLIRFLAGPLDGQERSKTARGRWPAYLDEQGAQLPPRDVQERFTAGRTDYYAKGVDALDSLGTVIGCWYVHRSKAIADARAHFAPGTTLGTDLKDMENQMATAKPKPSTVTAAQLEQAAEDERPIEVDGVWYSVAVADQP